MSKQGKKIEDIDQLLAMAGSNLSILEEEVDIKVQKEYFEMVTYSVNELKTTKKQANNTWKTSMTSMTIRSTRKSKRKCWSYWQLWTMFRYTVLSKIFRNKTLP